MRILLSAAIAALQVGGSAMAANNLQQPQIVAPTQFADSQGIPTPIGEPAPSEISPSDEYVEPYYGHSVPAPLVEPFDAQPCAPSPFYCAPSQPCCALGEPFSLKDSLLGPCSWLDMGGWTQLGYHSAATRLSTNYGDGLAFNDVPHQINLHQQWLWFEKQAQAPCCGWDWGFRFDMMYGTDAQKTQAFGNDDNVWDTSLDHGVYGWALPQAYVELASGDWSIIAGHFFTLIGYEVITAPDNFFYSHAYTMFNSEPFTHTGVLATYSGSDLAEFYAGYTLGWDTGFDQYTTNGTRGSSWLGGFSTQLTDDITFTYISTMGDFGLRNDPVGAGYPTPITTSADFGYSHSLVFDVALSDRWNYVLQSDMVNVPDVDHDQIGINQYLFYKSSDCLGYGARFEWWKNDGVDIYGLTYGVNYRPHANLVFRPEIRHNWAANEAEANAFYGTGEFDQTVFGMDMIFTY
jgi:hypothetical protein